MGPHVNGVFEEPSVRGNHEGAACMHSCCARPIDLSVPVVPQLRGIIPRIVEDIFDAMVSADEDMEFTAKISYVEIYLEKVRDLLDPAKDNLRVREDNSRNGRGVWLEGVTEEYAGSPDEMLEMLQRGTANRAIASTNMNSVCCRVWCGGCAALPAVAVVWSLMGVR